MKSLLTILFLTITWSIGAVEYLTPMTTTNGVVVKPSNFWDANSNAVNAVILHPEGGAGTTNLYVTNFYTTNFISTNFYTASNSFAGVILNPVSNGTNFLLDFAATNAYGVTALYHSILATNDVTLAVTNAYQWGLISMNAVASGGDRVISVPTNTFHPPSFYTNGWVVSGPYYSLTLSNGNELRMTYQSNITFSTTWQTYGQ